MVTILVTVDAGLSSEGTYAGTGISHFIEHMLFKGTAKRKPGQIETEIKSYGGVINGWTGFDGASYYITVPKEYTKEALDLMEDVIFHPAFDKTEMEKEREVILNEIRLNKDDPTRRVMRELWQTSFIEHPYKLPIIGYEGLFKELKREDLVKYHSSRYTPDNIVLSVVGDVDQTELLSWVKSKFEKQRRKRISVIASGLEPQQNSPRELKGFAEINLGYLAMGYHTVELSDNDLYGLDVLAIILGDWDGSRLNKSLVKDKRLLYSVTSFNYTPKYPGLFVIYGVGDAEKLEESRKEILEEIKRISASGVEKGELEAAKNIVISGYINLLETTGGLARAISQGEFLAGDPAFFEKYVENVKKVDNETVKRAAKRYLRENNLTVSYLYPARVGTGLSAGSVVPGRDLSPPHVPTRTLLSNGIRLILKEDHRIPKVSVVCAFLGGVRVETKENNGISNLTSAMLLKGTKKRKEDEVKSFIESRGGGISHFSGNNTFGISMDFLREDTEDALNLLEDVVENPVFPQEELEKEKEKLYAAIKAEDDDVYATGFRRLKKALFENYPYGLRIIGENDSLKKLQKKDLNAFHEKFSVGDNMVISVVGDFDSKEMRREIEKRFLDMNKTPLNIKAKKPQPLTGVKKVSRDMPREQSLLAVGFRGTTLKGPDRYSLQILCSVLSGENGRLYQSIRNELGLSYALGVFQTPGIDTGYVASYVATDKKHLKDAKDILFKELKKIKAGAIKEGEITLAKKALIGRQKISLETNKALAYQMALDEIYGIGYDNYINYPQIISNVTNADVSTAAKRYIDLNNLAVVTISGE